MTPRENPRQGPNDDSILQSFILAFIEGYNILSLILSVDLIPSYRCSCVSYVHTSLVLATKRIMKSNVMALRLPFSQEKKPFNIGVSSIYCQLLVKGVPKAYGPQEKIIFSCYVQKKRSFLGL